MLVQAYRYIKHLSPTHLILGLIIFYIIWKELFSKSTKEGEGASLSSAHLDAVEKLSQVAFALQAGTFTVPGNLRIAGKLEVDKEATFKKGATVPKDEHLNIGNYYFVGVDKSGDPKRLYLKVRKSPSSTWYSTQWSAPTDSDKDNEKVFRVYTSGRSNAATAKSAYIAESPISKQINGL